MTLYGYIRTSRALEPGAAGSDPESQRHQLRIAGVDARRIYEDVGVSGSAGVSSRRGWHALEERLGKGDVLVVAATDRIGRRYMDVMHTIHRLVDRGIRLRSLDPAEARWAVYLDADPDSPEYFMASLLAAFAAYAASQERQAVSRRTIAGLERARSEGRIGGRPRRFSDDEATAIRQRHEDGESIGSLARSYRVGKGTIRAALARA